MNCYSRASDTRMEPKGAGRMPIHVAIVEDDRKASDLLQAHLRRYADENLLQFRTSVFEHPLLFLEPYRADWDLVFMDIQMPVMNGIEATKKIRGLSDPWQSRIPIIAMTADAFAENVSECLAAGMNGHIAKPVDMKLVIKESRRIKEERQ